MSNKQFEMTHLILDTVTKFDETSPPDWLTCKENNWWWEDQILTLPVGKYRNSYFHKIKRIK